MNDNTRHKCSMQVLYFAGCKNGSAKVQKQGSIYVPNRGLKIDTKILLRDKDKKILLGNDHACKERSLFMCKSRGVLVNILEHII